MPQPISAKLRALLALGISLCLSASATATPNLPNSPPASAPVGCTGPASAHWLKVIVEGVRSDKGLIAITLYADDSSRFLMKGGSLYVGRTQAVAGTTTSCIYVPKPGVYVLAIYHDENGNQKFDRTGFGLPAEAYGFSNNPSTLLGLPTFRSVRLDVERSGLTSHIRLKYP